MRGFTHQMPVPFGKDLYQTWFEIEKSIRKFDRWFNKIEKFNGRKFTDVDNHERREKRMHDKKRERWVDNYTYFFGEHTEEEQMYRDYFETDLEIDPENEAIEEEVDESILANRGDFDPKLYDFVEAALDNEVHENFDDIIEQKIFKYKYRRCADGEIEY